MTGYQIVFIPILETSETTYKAHFHIVDLTAAVFCHNEFGKTTDVVTFCIVRTVKIILRTMDKAYDIRILLDGAGFTKVAELRAFTLSVGTAVFDRTVQLTQGNYRNV